MKRSKGVTAIAILMLLGGLYGIFTSWGGMVAPEAITESLEQIDLLLAERSAEVTTTSLEGNSDDQASTEDLEALRATLEDVQVVMSLPGMRTRFLIGGILSVLAAIASVGLLLLRRWARLLSIGQVIAACVLSLWFVMAIGSVNDIAAVSPQEQVVQSASKWIGFLISSGWAVLVIWFLNKPSVKEQF